MKQVAVTDLAAYFDDEITAMPNLVTVGTIGSGTWQGTAIAGGYIANDAIDSQHYADGSIDHAHLADSCVDGDNIANNSVNSEHYVDDSIDTDHIANSQVTYAKIQNVSATNRILGRDSSGSGVIEEITPANVRTMINVADGATADASASVVETKAGTNSAKFVTPASLAGRSVTATIDVSSLDSTQKKALIDHDLDTPNVIVEVHGLTSKEVYICEYHKDNNGSASDDHLTFHFAEVPGEDLVVTVTSCKTASSVTPTYPTS